MSLREESGTALMVCLTFLLWARAPDLSEGHRPTGITVLSISLRSFGDQNCSCYDVDLWRPRQGGITVIGHHQPYVSRSTEIICSSWNVLLLRDSLRKPLSLSSRSCRSSAEWLGLLAYAPVTMKFRPLFTSQATVDAGSSG